MDLETLIGIKVNTAIRVGRLFVPANSLSNALFRYVEPALFFSDLDYPYEFTKSGSLTRVKYNDRYFALVCAHQVTAVGYNYDQLFLRDPRSNTLLSSHEAFSQTDLQDAREDLDLLVFEFTQIVDAGDLPSNFWYDLDLERKWERLPLPNRVLCIGYPSEVNAIDYELPRYAAKAVTVWGRPAKSALSRRVAFTPESSPIYDPAGMSGGAVFAITIEENEPLVFFAGLLTEATKSVFNFVSATRVRRVLDVSIRQ